MDLLVIINLKGFQEPEGDGQALLQTDAVVTPEVFWVGLRVLGAAQVPRRLREQLTAALHCEEEERTGHIVRLCLLQPAICLLSHFSQPTCSFDLLKFLFTFAGVLVTLKLVTNPARTEVATHIVVTEVLALRPFIVLSSIVRITFIQI